MGTNYYFQPIPMQCGECKRAFPKKHIGKSSYRFRFALSADTASSWREMVRIISEPGYIEDEYGEEKGLDEFILFVESKQVKKSHFPHCLVDDDGFELIRGRFC